MKDEICTDVVEGEVFLDKWHKYKFALSQQGHHTNQTTTTAKRKGFSLYG